MLTLNQSSFIRLKYYLLDLGFANVFICGGSILQTFLITNH